MVSQRLNPRRLLFILLALTALIAVLLYASHPVGESGVWPPQLIETDGLPGDSPLALTSPLASTETVTPRPTMPNTGELYTSTLTLPDGHTLPTTCYWFGGPNLSHCYVEFPSGQRMDLSTDPDWSPDGQFAVVCFEATHDSPCRWWEVWDVVNGAELEKLYSDLWYEWSPDDGHILAYIHNSVYIGVETQLTIFDPATGEKSNPTTCPDWVRPNYQWANEVCEQLLESPTGGDGE